MGKKRKLDENITNVHCSDFCFVRLDVDNKTNAKGLKNKRKMLSSLKRNQQINMRSVNHQIMNSALSKTNSLTDINSRGIQRAEHNKITPHSGWFVQSNFCTCTCCLSSDTSVTQDVFGKRKRKIHYYTSQWISGQILHGHYERRLGPVRSVKDGGHLTRRGLWGPPPRLERRSPGLAVLMNRQRWKGQAAVTLMNGHYRVETRRESKVGVGGWGGFNLHLRFL